MKKTGAILMIALVLGSMTVFAQQKRAKADVPTAVKQAFQKEYPGTKVKWQNENGKYEAEFEQNGNETSLLYDVNGNIEETEIEIQASQLPAESKKYVLKHKLGKITESAMITKADGAVEYEVEVRGIDHIFDKNGNFIKKIKK